MIVNTITFLCVSVAKDLFTLRKESYGVERQTGAMIVEKKRICCMDRPICIYHVFFINLSHHMAFCKKRTEITDMYDSIITEQKVEK